jgi:hypothetical protein
MYGGVVQIVIDRTTDIVVAGIREWDRANGGIMIGPGGTSFPATPEANEWFLRTDTNELYRRDSSNSNWILISSVGGVLYTENLHVSSTEYVAVGNKTIDRKIVLNYSYSLPIANRSMVGNLIIHHNGVDVEISNEYSVMTNEFDDVEITGEILLDDILLKIVTPALIENPVLQYKRTVIPV